MALSVNDLRNEVHKDFATKNEIKRLDYRMEEVDRRATDGLNSVQTLMTTISVRLDEIARTVRWGMRRVVGILALGALIGAVFFLVSVL